MTDHKIGNRVEEGDEGLTNRPEREELRAGLRRASPPRLTVAKGAIFQTTSYVAGLC